MVGPKPSEPWAMSATDAVIRGSATHRYEWERTGTMLPAARSELVLRNAMEAFLRERYPEARLVHEIVMGEGKVRADVAALCPDHLVAVEVKGAGDNTLRLLHQVAMFQLCFPEVWMVVAENHGADADLIRHLMPQIGLIVGKGMGRRWTGEGSNHDEPVPVEFEVIAEPAPRDPVPEMMLRVCWLEELKSICDRLLFESDSRTTRRQATQKLLNGTKSDLRKLMPEVCRELRGREAQWRADPPVEGS